MVKSHGDGIAYCWLHQNWRKDLDYVESVSRDHLRESLLPPADSGPNYVKLSKELKSKEEGGLVVSLEKTN